MQSRDGLTVADLAVERGGRRLLAGLSFTVAPGTALAVTGANGIGKSTLLRALAGLLRPATGTVALHQPSSPNRDWIKTRRPAGGSPLPCGEGQGVRVARPWSPAAAPTRSAEEPSPLTPLRKGEGDAAHDAALSEALIPRFRSSDAPPVAERAHYLGHANGLKAALTAVEALRFRQRWFGGPGLAPGAALAAVDLAHCADIPTGLLSAGQKRRVALAGLLVATRPLWLLDEPAAALDVGSEAMLVGLLRHHLAGGGLAVMALHAPLDLPMATLRLGGA